MKKINLLILVLISNFYYAQVGVDWFKNFGGSGFDEGKSVDVNINGDIIIGGKTNSNDLDISGNLVGNQSVWLVKMNSNGDTLWTKVLTNFSNDINIIRVTPDNGIIVFGTTKTRKLDSSGNQIWEKNTAYVDAIINSNSSFEGLINNIGNDASIEKVNANGSSNSIINFAYQVGDYKSFVKSSNGNYFIGYNTEDVFGMPLGKIRCINNLGGTIWSNDYALPTAYFELKKILLKTDGSIMAGGRSIPIAPVLQNQICLINIDANGNELWNSEFGNNSWDSKLNDVNINASNEIYFVAEGGPDLTTELVYGINHSATFGLTYPSDLWLVKTSPNGQITYQGKYGGENPTIARINEMKLLNNGGEMIFAGRSSGSNIVGEIESNNGSTDLWVLKLKECSHTVTDPFQTPINVNCSGWDSQLEVTNNPSFNYVWYDNTSGSVLINQTSNFLDPSLPASTYSIISIFNNCPITSNGVVYNPNFIEPPVVQDICIISNDVLTGKNKVVWEKEQTTVIMSYNIYRENTQSGSFDLIGTTNYADSSWFLDLTANPNQQAYRYHIKYVDTCGNESLPGLTHKTMHLTINQGIGTTWNLIWTPYEGINYPSYNIYRGTNISNMTLLTTVPSNLTSYTDANAPGGLIYYQIEIESPNTCNPTKLLYNNSRSNISSNDLNVSLEENYSLGLKVYPNPTSIDFTIECDENFIGEEFILTDFSGRNLKSGTFNSNFEKVDLETFANGVYLIQVKNRNIQQRIIKQ